MWIKTASDKGPEVVRCTSLNFEASAAILTSYTAIMFGESELTRYEREWIASRVSQLNRCFY